MKVFLLAMTVLCLSTSAFAERLIIQNPSDMKSLLSLKSVSVKKEFSLGENKFVVVEGMDTKSLKELVRAEKIFRDVEVSLPGFDQKAEKAGSAWHVDSLQYDKFPTIPRGKKIIVAVIDTGVDYNHIALKKRIWKNSKEIAGNNIDDDGNGYIDDVNGWDFASDDNDPMDSGSHGTHCAGIVAAEKQIGGNARGIAPHVKIMPLRLIGSQGKAFLSDSVDAIKYAVDNGAHILTNSWRLYSTWATYWDEDASKLLKAAIAYAGSKDVIFVAAAGNERKNNDDRLEDAAEEKIVPAGYIGLSNLFVVASSKAKEGVSGFTNYGIQSVAVAAPGSNIMSTVPGNKWRKMSGTSMATPLVAGALAYGLAMGMTPEEAMENMKSTTNRSAVWDTKVQTGHINLLDYLK